MKLIIDPSKSINQLKKEFNSIFPYLKIELFDHKHLKAQGNSKKDMINEQKHLGQYMNTSKVVEIHVQSHNTVHQFEKSIFEKTGLSIQVFRKSGNSWLETTITDSWTLEEQNKQGLELSKETPTFKEEVDEADIQ